MTGADVQRDANAVLLASFAGPVVPAWLLRRIEHGLGGVCLFAANVAGGVEAVAAALHRARPDVLVATDEEGGDVTRLWATSGSPVPGNAALGAVDDVDLTESVTVALGAVLAAAGIDLVLAPVADINSEPANPAIGVRSFGPEADLVARHVRAAVHGFERAGVAACVKHFPGHGATRVDSHLDVPVLDLAPGVLERRELVPFRAAIDAGVATVMAGHIVVAALDTEPATFSHPLLVDLLRNELGFAGAVVTDALDMGGAAGGAAIPESVVRSLVAGADLCCLGPEATEDLVDRCARAIVDALAGGTLTRERLREAAARVAAIRRVRSVPPPVAAAELGRLGTEAARRALRIDGQVPALVAPHVIELERPPMIAAGPVPSGLAGALVTLDPATTAERVDPELTSHHDVAAALQRAAGRPLAIVVRDPCRHHPQARLLAALLAARPDAYIVDLGWPAPATPIGAGRITTHGASAASVAAAARRLLGLELTEDVGG